MFVAYCEISRERILIIEYQQIVNQLNKKIPSWDSLIEKETKRCLWTQTYFIVRNQKLYCLANWTYPELQKVILKSRIWDTIIQNHNSLEHTGQDPTSKAINQAYYDII